VTAPLTGLQFLHFALMPLLQFLRLLLVPLLHLLLLSGIRVLFRHLDMLLILLQLELLAFLILLIHQFVLLLLVFLVLLRISGIGICRLHRRKVIRMDGGAGRAVRNRSAIFRRMIFAACFTSRYDGRSVKLSRTIRGSDRRFAVIRTRA